MSGRRTLLFGSIGLVLGTAPINSRAAKKYPDADLLTLCARLAEAQAEWQRLWSFTSDNWGMDDPPRTEADHAWLDDNDNVWPGIDLASGAWGSGHIRHPDDLLGQLHEHHAVTLDGLRAKAAAILAADDAGCYGGDIRDDWHQLTQSILQDAAGPVRMLMGEDAPK